MRKALTHFLLVVLLMLLVSPAAFAISVEQVQAVMPNIDVYLYDEEAALPSCPLEEIQAQLEDKPLTVKSLERSEEGIFYFFMLDISSSIPSDYFEAAKKVVLDTYASMGPRDQLAVITFGNEVSLLLDGSESKQQVTQALNSLTAMDEHTKFYNAMDALIEAATAVKDMRRVAVVISDGIDDTDAGMTQAELEQLLQRSGVAVYALSIDSMPEETTQAFRSFIQLSGGELYLFSPQNAEEVAAELLGRIGTIWHLSLTADSNLADGKTHALTLTFGQASPVAAQVDVQHWVPDYKAPQLTFAAIEQPGTALLKFSEPMLGLEDASHYALRDPNGKTISVAAKAEAAGNAVHLAAEGLDTGAGWTLLVSGLTDASMEENPLPETQLALDGSGVVGDNNSQNDTQTQPEGLGVLNVIHPVLLLGGVLAAGMVVAVCMLLRRQKSAEPKTKAKKENNTQDVSTGKQTVKFLFGQEKPKSGK